MYIYIYICVRVCACVKIPVILQIPFNFSVDTNISNRMIVMIHFVWYMLCHTVQI